MGSSITFSYQGIGDNILRADFMVYEMRRRGQMVLDRCIETAPVYEGTGEDPHRGRYKESFSMYTTNHGGSKSNRAAAVITNTAPEALDVEYGAHHWGKGRTRVEIQPGHHTMYNAMGAAGD